MIYFIQSTVMRHIKIGYAKSPRKRLAGLQTSSADELNLPHQATSFVNSLPQEVLSPNTQK